MQRVDFDKVLERVGQFGRYQFLTTMIVSLVSFPVGFHAVASVFEAAVPTFSCLSDGLTLSAAGEEVNDACEMHTVHGNASRQEDMDNVTSTFSVANVTAAMMKTVKCEHFQYDDSVFKSTIVTEWDLVCDRAWMRSLSTSFFMLGNLIGVIIFGHLADRYGRKCLFWLNLMTIVTGSAVAFAPDYWSYTMLRLVTGAATMGEMAILFTHGMEVVGIRHRVLFGVGVVVPFAASFILLSGIAYFLRDYTWLQLTISLAGVLLIPPLYWVGESPRWLLRRGRLEEAEREIRRMAKMNGREFPADLWNSTELLEDNQKMNEGVSKEPRRTAFALVKTPNMRYMTMILCYTWLVVAMMYYGLSLGSSALAGSPFLNLALMGFMELPALLLLYVTMDRFGRKRIVVGALLAGGLACGLVGIVPSDITWLITALALSGKLFSSVSFGLIYIYAAEIYPTNVRAIGVGTCSMCARVGTLLAPFVADLGSTVWPPFAQVVFGSLSLLAGLLCLMLPETLGCKLLETLEDGEDFGKLACPGFGSRSSRTHRASYTNDKGAGNAGTDAQQDLLNGRDTICKA